MRGRIIDIARGADGRARVLLSLEGGGEIAALKDCEVAVEIKKYRERRSLDANAYAWVLISKIAEAITPPLSKEECYLEMLRRYGKSNRLCVLSEAVPDLKRAYKYVDVINEGTLGGQRVTYVAFYVGTSEYDSREMATFLDGVIEEAKSLGIDTDTPMQRLRWEATVCGT